MTSSWSCSGCSVFVLVILLVLLALLVILLVLVVVVVVAAAAVVAFLLVLVVVVCRSTCRQSTANSQPSKNVGSQHFVCHTVDVSSILMLPMNQLVPQPHQNSVRVNQEWSGPLFYCFGGLHFAFLGIKKLRANLQIQDTTVPSS